MIIIPFFVIIAYHDKEYFVKGGTVVWRMNLQNRRDDGTGRLYRDCKVIDPERLAVIRFFHGIHNHFQSKEIRAAQRFAQRHFFG